MTKTGSTSTLDAVRQLAPSIRARAAEIEAGRRLPPGLVADLVDAGCYRMLVPRARGGDEATLLEGLELFEELGAADGSVGWTVQIGCSYPALAGVMPSTMAERIYADGPDVIMAGTFAPAGTAVAHGDEHRVSGQWKFASGCQHATWLGVQCVVVDGEGQPVPGPDGQPEVRLFVYPPEDIEIVDTWWAGGLRGSGSHDLRADGAMCPDGMSLAFLDDPAPGSPPIGRIPVTSQITLWTAAVAVGIAQAALDEIVGVAGRGKQSWFSEKRLAQSEVFQSNVGRADASLRAARALLHTEAEAVWDKACSPEPFTPLERGRLRATGAQVTALAVGATEAAYVAGGGSAVHESSPLQRQLRDIRTLSQHPIVSPEAFETAGALMVGEPIGNPFRL